MRDLTANYILDENGNPKVEPDIIKWADWFGQRDRRTVAKTYMLGKKIMISTVFLGIDHNWELIGEPVLFETMIFAGNWSEQYQDRYTTKDLALAGHAVAVAWAKKHFVKLSWEVTKAFTKYHWKELKKWVA